MKETLLQAWRIMRVCLIAAVMVSTISFISDADPLKQGGTHLAGTGKARGAALTISEAEGVERQAGGAPPGEAVAASAFGLDVNIDEATPNELQRDVFRAYQTVPSDSMSAALVELNGRKRYFICRCKRHNKKSHAPRGREGNIMTIHVFSDHTGMVERRIVPEYKTRVEIVGGVKTGTLSLGDQNFEIKGGEALVPMSAFKKDAISVSITAKDGKKVRHWICGTLKREPSGAYEPDMVDARGALILAMRAIDELRGVVAAQAADIKKLQEQRASRKLIGGAE